MRIITFISRRWLLLLLLLAGAALAGPAQAQVSTYTFAASAGTFTPLPAVATNVPTLRVDDATSGATLLPFGFSFVFDGVAYTGVKACSNGFLSFNPNATYNVGNALDGTAAASEKPLLAPLWDDLSGDASTSRASYLTTGTAPNRVFTFEWLNWKWSYQAPSPSLSFQVKLYEGSNRIEYVYQPIAAAPTAGPSLGASIGLAGMVPGTNPSQFLSLNNASAAPVASSNSATTNIATMPAAGQNYAFVPSTGGGCGPPFNVAVNSVTGTTASVAFQGPAAATGYVVTYQATGGAVQTVAPVPTASPVALSGLLSGTAYYVTVASTCGGQVSSTASATFTTAAGYCVTSLGGACGPDNILAVNIVGTTLNASGLTCASAGTPPQAYTSYPASGSTTGSIERGQSYQLSVTTGTTDIVSAWIDYDHSLTFDAGEWMQVAVSSTTNMASVVSVAVPATAVLGATILRVRSRRVGNANGATDACTSFGLADTKDFVVTIVAPGACAPPSGLSAGSPTATGATLSFAGNGGGGAITVVYGPAGFDPATGGTTVTPASSPLVLSGLAPGTAYQFYVRQACGGTASSSALAGPVGFSTVPANDDPCAATVLAVNPTACTLLSATNAAATVTTNPSVSAGACMGANISPRDVWFSFTTAATGPTSTAVRIAVAGASASIVQGLRAASCAGPFVSLRCVGSQSNVAAPVLDLTALTPGTQYWVRVHTFQFSDPLGAFSICATATTVSATAAAADPEVLQVYPNPSAGGRLTLRRSQPLAGELTLFDALGQAVRREALRPATEHTLATAGLAPGLYTLRVVAGGQVFTRRVVLE